MAQHFILLSLSLSSQEISNGVVNVTGDVPHCSLCKYASIYCMYPYLHHFIYPYISIINICIHLGPMSRTVLILVGLFGVASVAGTFRNYLFTVAGERFVARLRKNVTPPPRYSIIIICNYIVIFCNYETRNGLL